MSVTGRQLVFRPGFRVDVEPFELPAPSARQALVRVTRSQVSAGSEMNGLRALEAAGTGERTSGYTTVGRVLAVGAEVTGLAPGDRILCYGHHASHCLINVGDGSGWRAVPDRLPDSIADEHACFAVLGDVALHGVRRASLQIDESVAVFGAGVVGQLTIQFARLSGAYPIVAVDLDEARLALARQHGATHTVNARAGDPAAAVRAITNGGASAVFHCSANPTILQTTLEAAGNRGKVVLTGSAPGTAEIGLQVELLRHELTILGVYETGLETPHPYWPWTRQRNRHACYRLIASGAVQVATMMTHTVPPEQAQEMYRMMAAGPGDWMAITYIWE